MLKKYIPQQQQQQQQQLGVLLDLTAIAAGKNGPQPFVIWCFPFVVSSTFVGENPISCPPEKKEH